jgi:hypothetical protein
MCWDDVHCPRRLPIQRHYTLPVEWLNPAGKANDIVVIEEVGALHSRSCTEARIQCPAPPRGTLSLRPPAPCTTSETPTPPPPPIHHPPPNSDVLLLGSAFRGWGVSGLSRPLSRLSRPLSGLSRPLSRLSRPLSTACHLSCSTFLPAPQLGGSDTAGAPAGYRYLAPASADHQVLSRACSPDIITLDLAAKATGVSQNVASRTNRPRSKRTTRLEHRRRIVRRVPFETHTSDLVSKLLQADGRV